MTRLRCVIVGAARISMLGMVSAGSLAAQSSIRTEVDTTLVTVGDRITLAVSVEHDTGASLAWPDSIGLAPFEILDARMLPPETQGDRTRETALLSLAAFELGELMIPSFDVTVVAADGSTESLATDRYGIEVVTVGADETGDIRGIRGPFGIAISAVRVVLLGVLLLLFAALAFGVFRRLRRSGPAAGRPAPGPAPRPAHEVALEALARIESSPMLDRGQVKEYHIQISDVLRRYVEARYGVTALEMTTWEIIAGLDRAGVESDVREGLRRLLDQCDLVKFAKVRPGADASLDVLHLGRRLVESSIARAVEADRGSPVTDTTVTENEPPVAEVAY